MDASGATIGWIGGFSPAARIWLIHCVHRKRIPSPPSKPMRMEMGPGREIYQHGQSLYVEDLPLRYPQASQLLALNAPTTSASPSRASNGLPLGQLTPAARRAACRPHAPCSTPLRAA